MLVCILCRNACFQKRLPLYLKDVYMAEAGMMTHELTGREESWEP